MLRVTFNLFCLMAGARACRSALLLFAASAVAVQAAEVSKEYQVKAAFLYNFTKFVEWPPQRFADPSAPIVIGVLGTNPFGDELSGIVNNRSVNGRAIVVRELDSVDEAREAHLVFVSASEEKRVSAVAERLQASGTVTVGETTPFSRSSGVIVFTLEGDKVRFEIDQDAAERAGVKLSAQLLKLATKVRRKN